VDTVLGRWEIGPKQWGDRKTSGRWGNMGR